MKSDWPIHGPLLPYVQTYPAQLLAVHKPLPLYFRGDFSLVEHPRLLAVVGSRMLTSENQAALFKIMKSMHSTDIAIVSGLARGCDALAHTLALENHLPTIAVLGSGLADDEIYPPSNFRLAEKILGAGGLLLSPFAPQTPIMQYNFPIRNQIIAAVVRAIVIVSAAQKSGALITARLALEYGKDVFVIPGSITDPLYAGSNLLLQQGATPLLAADDLLNYFEIPVVATVRYMVTDAVEKRILEQLQKTLTTANDLSRTLNIPPHQVSSCLSKFELKGWIRFMPDGTIQLL